MFDGFTAQDITVTDTTIHALTGGSGPPVLLLHGYPQTHVSWRKVAPALADRFRLVVPDLRGYGRSGKPPSDPGHLAYAKRTMARDMVEVMGALGYDRFFVAGHDRGGRVAYRMALDHPERVERLATLDILPTYATWRAMRGTAGLVAYHWYFLAQPPDLPERLIRNDPTFFLHRSLGSWREGTWQPPPSAIEPAALTAYQHAFEDPDMIRATCEDYRAGATIDAQLDREDRDAGHKIGCPTLVLWGADSDIPGDYYLSTWQEWAADVRDQPISCGHFLPEEAPQETAAALRAFFDTAGS